MLYLVPTPIGNLGDITMRALEVLRQADFVACEDTRRTQKLLSHYQIRKELVSYHDHSPVEKLQKIIELLKDGKTAAFVTDSGMPLISDPGFPLVREAIRCGIGVQALPGPSAVITALAASGLAAEAFSFFGFLPPKSAARKRILASLATRTETLIFYESPFRVIKLLTEMKEVLGDREAVAARELTKVYEETVRGYLSEITAVFSKKAPKGEFVILVSGAGRKDVLHEKDEKG